MVRGLYNNSTVGHEICIKYTNKYLHGADSFLRS